MLPPCDNNENIVLSLTHLQGAFYLLLSGIMGALCMLLIEKVLKNIKGIGGKRGNKLTWISKSYKNRNNIITEGDEFSA